MKSSLAFLAHFSQVFGFVLFGAIGAVNCEDVLSAKDKEAVRQFYPMVKDGFTKEIQHGERYLIRWIQARNYDLKAAEELLRRNFAWRKENNMDNILEEDFSDWEKRYPYNFLTHDHEGRPGGLCYLAMAAGIGQIDVRKLALLGKRADLDRYMVYGYERGLYNVDNHKYVDGYILFNMAGYTPRTHACLPCISSWIRVAQNYELYYPRLVRSIISVNTPRIFQNLVSVLKPLLTEHTAQGLRLYGLNRDEFRRELLKTFPEDQLLPEFGGTLITNNTVTILSRPSANTII